MIRKFIISLLFIHNFIEALEDYCNLIHNETKADQSEQIIGREKEIQQLVQFFSDEKKQSILLVGDHGVGKTSVIREFARQESSKKNIYQLDNGKLIKNVNNEYGLSKNLQDLFTQAQQYQGTTILVIDNLDQFIESSPNTIIKPLDLLASALDNDNFKCICTTTHAGYKKIVKARKLLPHFKKMMVSETTIEESLAILRTRKKKWENKFGVTITDLALQEAVNLSARKIKDKLFPLKAIEVMESAVTKVQTRLTEKPEKLIEIEQKINRFEIEQKSIENETQNKVTSDRLYEISGILKMLNDELEAITAQWEEQKSILSKIKKKSEEYDKIKNNHSDNKKEELENQLTNTMNEIKKLEANYKEKTTITQEDIALAVSQDTGIKEEIHEKSIKLADIIPALEKRVIGQDEAVKDVSKTIQMYRAKLHDTNKPIGSFLFLGTTGVGKTELAKAITELLFQTDTKLIRFDMSEYSDQYKVNRLLGSPPGYVGYHEGGQLTDVIHKNPHAVILFDEIEKADPKIFDIFLQILDEGRLTDSQGNLLDFTNTIIIMTSNIGSTSISKAQQINDQVKQEVTQELNKTFKPEFLNRIDKRIFFNPLNQDTIKAIVKSETKTFTQRAQERNIAVTISDEVINFITNTTIKEAMYGARPVKRAIENYLTKHVSTFICEHEGINKIDIDFINDQIILTPDDNKQHQTKIDTIKKTTSEKIFSTDGIKFDA